MQLPAVSLHQPQPAVEGNPPVGITVSAVLPARNEEENIRAAVESLAAQPEISEIVVVDDHSTDRTAALLAELSQCVPRLCVIRNGALPEGWVGKSYALTTGVREARSDWLLFTDADVRHLPGSAGRALALAASTGATLVSFSPAQEMRSWWERAVIPRVYCTLAREFSYEEVSNPASLVAAANGQYLLIRRDAYVAVGGHAAVRGEILEDVALARRVKQAGFRLHFARGEGIARTRMYCRFGQMWRGWTKNLFALVGRDWWHLTALLARIALADLLPVIGLLSALLVRFSGGSDVWLWAAGLALAAVIARHVAYGIALRQNRFPLSCIWYYLIGSVLFAGLLIHSAVKHARGSVEWKGRRYAV